VSPAPDRPAPREALGVRASGLSGPFLRPRGGGPRGTTGGPARNSRATTTLAVAFDPRSNSLSVLRLLLAGTVAVAHTLDLGFGFQPQAGSSDFGSLAVDGFFVLSGFLVARSYLRLDSLRRFAWHRALRILPGFWACLLGTGLVVAPLLAVLVGRPWTSVFSGEDSAWSYVVSDAALVMRQFTVAGLPGTATSTDQLDGSLWTLAFEASCYAALAVLGVLGVLRRRALVLGLVLVLWALTVAPVAGLDVLGHPLLQRLHGPDVLRFGLVFLLGAAGHLYADRVPVRGVLALAGTGLVVVGLALLPDHRALAAPAFAYVVLYAVVRLPLRWTPPWDLSYGVYVWHWPVAQLLTAAGAAALTTAPFVLLGLAVTAVLAAASWTLVERPALGLKDAAWVTGGRARP